jgi:hypothetical protein
MVVITSWLPAHGEDVSILMATAEDLMVFFEYPN